MFGLFSRNKEPSWSVVVVPPGEHKVQDVEAKLYAPAANGKVFAGKLWQDRWSHGEGRFRVQVRKLPAGHEGKARLYRDGELVSQFEVSGRVLDFKWRGQVTGEMPQFDIGQKVRVEIGGWAAEGIVEPD